MELGFFSEFLAELSDSLAGPASRLWPVYLFVTLLITLAIHRIRKVETPFLEWLLPKSVYLHASHIVDLKIFFVNRAIAMLGLFNMVFISAYIAVTLPDLIGSGVLIEAKLPLLKAFLLLIASDLSVYIVHRFHHENRIFWPFHALHHSAEVMTPITVYRKHPVYDIVSSVVRAVLMGGIQGIMIALFADGVSFLTIAGINACYLAFNMAAANLRHTHIWLSFGPVLEYLFISPAQHQIHHSLNPKHHNKNYGEVLAIWDWMFGTLYVPSKMEALEFGIGDKDGVRIQQPHDSLTNAMVVPIKDSWLQIAKRIGSRNKTSKKPVPSSK